MANVVLDRLDGLPRIALVPEAVERLGDSSKLDCEVAGEVLRLGFAPLFMPEANEGGLVRTHDDTGIRAADEGLAISKFSKSRWFSYHQPALLSCCYDPKGIIRHDPKGIKRNFD